MLSIILIDSCVANWAYWGRQMPRTLLRSRLFPVALVPGKDFMAVASVLDYVIAFSAVFDPVYLHSVAYPFSRSVDNHDDSFRT